MEEDKIPCPIRDEMGRFIKGADLSSVNGGEKNGMWKETGVGRSSLHEWVRNHLPEPELCEECGKVPPYDLANISQEYKRDLDDWEYLCRRCHMNKDGRIKNLKQYQIHGE